MVAASLLLSTLVVVLTLYVPILTGDVVDLLLGKGLVDMPGVLAIMAKIAIAVIVTAAAQWVMNTCNNYITYHVIRDIREDAFKKLEILPLQYMDTHAYGEVVSRVITDVDTFADGLLMGFTQLFTGLLTIFGTLIFMLLTNISITLVVVCITPVSILVARFIATRTYSMFRSQSEIRGEQTALVEEAIGNLKVVKAFSKEEDMQAQFDEINGRLQKSSLKAIFFSSLTNPCTRFVNSLVYAGVGVFGALLAVRGGISVGRLSCFLSYANQYTKPFNEISGVVTELQNAIACAGRIFELIEETPQVPEPEQVKVLTDAQASRTASAPIHAEISGTTSLASVNSHALTIMATNGALTLRSTADQTVRVVAMNGTTVANVPLQAGKEETIPLPAGIYIVDNRKVIIR